MDPKIFGNIVVFGYETLQIVGSIECVPVCVWYIYIVILYEIGTNKSVWLCLMFIFLLNTLAGLVDCIC